MTTEGGAGYRRSTGPGASGALAGFDRPALVVWAAGDRVMAPEQGRRLAEPPLGLTRTVRRANTP